MNIVTRQQARDTEAFHGLHLGLMAKIYALDGRCTFQGIVASLEMNRPGAPFQDARFTLVSLNTIQRAPNGSGYDYWHRVGQRFFAKEGEPNDYFHSVHGNPRRSVRVWTGDADIETWPLVLSPATAQLAKQYRPGARATYRYKRWSAKPVCDDVNRVSHSVHVQSSSLRRIRVVRSGQRSGALCTVDLELNRPLNKPSMVRDLSGPQPFHVEF